MPKLDKTGPIGNGPMTGHGQGKCSGGGKRMFWCGRGLGMGKFAQSQKNTHQTLEDEEKMLLEELKRVRAEKEAFKDKK